MHFSKYTLPLKLFQHVNQYATSMAWHRLDDGHVHPAMESSHWARQQMQTSLVAMLLATKSFKDRMRLWANASCGNARWSGTRHGQMRGETTLKTWDSARHCKTNRDWHSTLPADLKSKHDPDECLLSPHRQAIPKHNKTSSTNSQLLERPCLNRSIVPNALIKKLHHTSRGTSERCIGFDCSWRPPWLNPSRQAP